LLCRHSPQDKSVIEVNVEKGMASGDKIVFRGQADEAPGVETGDVIFVIQETPHAVFKRQGCDLVMVKTIALSQALTGLQFVVSHLDGSQVLVVSAPGEVIAPGDVRAVVGKGMPLKGNPFSKGDLFVKFDVTFPKPKTLTPAQLRVRATLPRVWCCSRCAGPPL
jgi:DnaJ family protein A protein 2